MSGECDKCSEHCLECKCKKPKKEAPWRYTKSDLTDAFLKTKGNVTAAAEFLGVHKDTIYQYLSKDEELENALYQARKGKELEFGDYCESVLKKVISMVETRPALAVANAKYYLEKKSKRRGYSPSDDIQISEKVVEQYDSLMDQVKRLQDNYSARKIDDSNISAEQKS